MNTYTNKDGKYKSGMRRIAIAHGLDVGKAKAALFLPGPEQTCLKEALANGLIDKNTYIVAVEKDEATAAIIERYLKANFKLYHIHVGDLYTLDLKGLMGDTRLDFAYVDLCGQLTDKILMWIRQELNPICKQMAFTFSINVRSNNLIQKHLLPILSGKVNWEWTLKRFQRMCEKGANFNLNQYDDGQYATAYGLSLALLNGCDIEGWFPYRDQRTPMVLALASGGKWDTNGTCIAESIDYKPVVRWYQSTNRPNMELSPAHKAWVTRRARAS